MECFDEDYVSKAGKMESFSLPIVSKLKLKLKKYSLHGFNSDIVNIPELGLYW
jgi:hypothetical protein